MRSWPVPFLVTVILCLAWGAASVYKPVPVPTTLAPLPEEPSLDQQIADAIRNRKRQQELLEQEITRTRETFRAGVADITKRIDAITEALSPIPTTPLARALESSFPIDSCTDLLFTEGGEVYVERHELLRALLGQTSRTPGCSDRALIRVRINGEDVLVVREKVVP